MRNKKQAQGFTLIELLIVIAIIGILAAVLIPNLLSARNRARDSAAQACASALLQQAEIYQIDKNTYVGFGPAVAGYEPGPACSATNTGAKAVTVNTVNEVGGTVVSLGGPTFTWSNVNGIQRQAAP